MPSMNAAEVTPVSLLERLRRLGDAAAWARFVHLYSPLMFFWARRAGLQEADAADLVQDVFTLLLGKMPSFVDRPGESFRAWLRTVLTNKLREQRRRQAAAQAGDQTLELVEAPTPPEFLADPREQLLLLRRALGALAAELRPGTWDAFRLTALEGKKPEDVAVTLNLSVNAVYIARCRVLSRLREEFQGLLDE
jgi:RNA polymerase sigma-70 factor (ECF subfamily)